MNRRTGRGDDICARTALGVAPHLLFGICLFSVIFLPPLFYYVAEASSQAVGVCVAAVVILAVGIFSWRYADRETKAGWQEFLARVVLMAALVSAVIFAHLGIASLLHDEARPVVWMRSLLSLGPMDVLLMAGAVGGRYLVFAPSQIIDSCAKIMVGAMLAVVLWSRFGIQPESAHRTCAPMFPFSEPSHFALASLSFFLYFCAMTRNEHRRFFSLLGVLCVLMLMYKSLVFSAGVLLIIGLTCPPRYLLPVCLLFVAVHLTDVPYYAQRLPLTSTAQTSNLSELVYRQGWELMAHENSASFGWGIGFQQLGLYPPDLPATREIQAHLNGRMLNVKDGSFVMAKLVSEFGVFGLVATLAYIVAWLKAARLLRQYVVCRVRQDGEPVLCNPNTIFALSIFVGYGVEFFARGVGYFSGTTVLFLAACTYLLYEREILWRRA